MRTRLASGLAAFAAAAVAIPLLIYRAMEAGEVETPAVHLHTARFFNKVLSEIPPVHERERRAIVLFGDSTALAYPVGRTVPDRLRQMLASRPSRDADLYSLAALGTGPFDHYLMADRIMDAQPEIAVVLLNMASFSERWAARMARPELSGWVDWSRLGEAATLPLDWIGLTWDRLLLYKMIVGIGADDVWYRTKVQQARVGAARRDLEKHIRLHAARQQEMGHRTWRRFAIQRSLVASTDLPRYNAQAERAHYGDVLDGLRRDHPVLRVFEAAMRRFATAGCYVVVVVVPMNVEHLSVLGMSTRGVDASMETLVRVVVELPGTLLDLHDALPDEAFRDAAGHFTVSDTVDGPALLAKAVWPVLSATIDQTRPH